MKRILLIAFVLFLTNVGSALACDYSPAYAAYGRAVQAYKAGSYERAYSGARAAADDMKLCLKKDNPKLAISQENKALWASYLVAAADAGSRMQSYPMNPTRSELRSLVETAIQAEKDVLASPYSAELSKATIRDELPKFRALLQSL